MIIKTKQLKVEFTNEEKENIRKFHKLIDDIDNEMLRKKVEIVEIDDICFTREEISNIEGSVWAML